MADAIGTIIPLTCSTLLREVFSGIPESLYPSTVEEEVTCEAETCVRDASYGPKCAGARDLVWL